MVSVHYLAMRVQREPSHLSPLSTCHDRWGRFHCHSCKHTGTVTALLRSQHAGTVLMCGQWQAIHSQIRHTRGQFSCAGFAAAAETSRRASLIRGQIPPTLRSCFAHRASLRNPTPSSTTFLKKRQPTILSVPFFKFPLYTPDQIKQPCQGSEF